MSASPCSTTTLRKTAARAAAVSGPVRAGSRPGSQRSRLQRGDRDHRRDERHLEQQHPAIVARPRRLRVADEECGIDEAGEDEGGDGDETDRREADQAADCDGGRGCRRCARRPPEHPAERHQPADPSRPGHQMQRVTGEVDEACGTFVHRSVPGCGGRDEEAGGEDEDDDRTARPRRGRPRRPNHPGK